MEYGFGELEKKRWRGGGARVAGVAEAVKDAFFSEREREDKGLRVFRDPEERKWWETV